VTSLPHGFRVKHGPSPSHSWANGRMSDSVQEAVQIIYDGQCPACDAYFRFQRLEQNGINVHFIDAREHPEIVRAYFDRGIDLNRDFVLCMGTAEYVGGDAVFVLASLGTKGNFFRWLNVRLFRSRSVSHAVYRLLRVGRRLLLLLLGRRQLDSRDA
jgi:predicted DCC family thiol-disulfide oxidoreductase YuxK